MKDKSNNQYRLLENPNSFQLWLDVFIGKTLVHSVMLDAEDFSLTYDGSDKRRNFETHRSQARSLVDGFIGYSEYTNLRDEARSGYYPRQLETNFQFYPLKQYKPPLVLRNTNSSPWWNPKRYF